MNLLFCTTACDRAQALSRAEFFFGGEWIMADLMEAASELTFGVWFLIGAALVFFMQCGFAMVEAGFTRAKNAGNDDSAALFKM